MNLIYAVAGNRLRQPEVVRTLGGLIVNVGQTDRSVEERLKDPDYARKAAGGDWNILGEWHRDNITDHDVHKELKLHPDVGHEKEEEFLFKTDCGDGSEVRKILEEVIKKLTGKIHKALLPFAARPYQQDDLLHVVEKLTTLHRVLLSAFPGWGKSTTVPYIMHSMCGKEQGHLFLCTAPMRDTLDNMYEAIKTIEYGDRRFFAITDDKVDANTEMLILEKLKEGTHVIVLASVQGLRRGENGTRKITKEEAVTINSTLRTKFAFLYNIKIRLWVRDEFHKEYGGLITKIVFKGIGSEYLLDVTATPYNLIELGEYIKDQIIGSTILNVLKKKREGVEWVRQFPQIHIETWEGAPLRNTELGDLYTQEEEWDPRKLFAVKNNQLIHATGIRALNRRMYGWTRLLSGRYIETDSKEKNPLSILGDTELSQVAKEFGYHVLSEGDKENEANVRCKLYEETLNSDPNQKMWYVTAEFVKTQAHRQGLRVVDFVIQQREVAKQHGKIGLIIVTHRMLLTGSDIDRLGHIVLLDKIGSLNDFVQLIGRLFRVYLGKDNVKLYVACPGMSVSVKVYQAAKAEAHQYGDGDPKEYFDCIPITEYGPNMERRSVSYEDMVKRFNEHQNRILNGDWMEGGFLSRFPELDDLTVGLEFDALDGGGSGSSKITEKTKAKVKVNKRTIRDIERENKNDQLGKSWKETVATMLNESIRIGNSNNSASLLEVFNTESALDDFRENNIKLIHAVFQCEEFYQVVNNKYVERLNEVKGLDINNQWFEKIYRNALYKQKRGTVYVPPQLAAEVVNNTVNLHDLYSGDTQALINEKGFVIIIINALSGTFAVAARERFPRARIICVEWFPFEVKHLQRLGVDVVVLNKNVENITVEYMNSKLQQQIKENEIAYIIINPPYQSLDDRALYKKFQEKVIDIAGQYTAISIITPASYLAGVKSKNIRNLFSNVAHTSMLDVKPIGTFTDTGEGSDALVVTVITYASKTYTGSTKLRRTLCGITFESTITLDGEDVLLYLGKEGKSLWTNCLLNRSLITWTKFVKTTAPHIHFSGKNDLGYFGRYDKDLAQLTGQKLIRGVVVDLDGSNPYKSTGNRNQIITQTKTEAENWNRYFKSRLLGVLLIMTGNDSNNTKTTLGKLPKPSDTLLKTTFESQEEFELALYKDFNVSPMLFEWTETLGGRTSPLSGIKYDQITQKN